MIWCWWQHLHVSGLLKQNLKSVIVGEVSWEMSNTSPNVKHPLKLLTFSNVINQPWEFGFRITYVWHWDSDSPGQPAHFMLLFRLHMFPEDMAKTWKAWAFKNLIIFTNNLNGSQQQHWEALAQTSSYHCILGLLLRHLFGWILLCYHFLLWFGKIHLTLHFLDILQWWLLNDVSHLPRNFWAAADLSPVFLASFMLRLLVSKPAVREARVKCMQG